MTNARLTPWERCAHKALTEVDVVFLAKLYGATEARACGRRWVTIGELADHKEDRFFDSADKAASLGLVKLTPINDDGTRNWSDGVKMTNEGVGLVRKLDLDVVGALLSMSDEPG